MENNILPNDWNYYLKDEINKDYFKNLISTIDNERKSLTIYPKSDDVFNAFKLTTFNNIKVVIIGQDPYYKPNQANGLAFSVNSGEKLPKSLKNIFLELKDDLHIDFHDGDLSSWAKQGVLLLNTSLTVIKDKPNSHKSLGWQTFTKKVIQVINDNKNGVVFILWGDNAKSYKEFIDLSKNKIIESSHPSPLSAYRGFFGSKPFSKTNELLKNANKTTIDWSK
jgi:uracil-DNA glycosylase